MTIRDLLEQAAAKYGDPRMTRLQLLDWLAIGNEALEALTLDWKVLEEDATFDILANESRYVYPEQAVQLRRVQYSETPSDDATWRDLNDKPWDAFRSATTTFLPQNTPWCWTPRATFFELTPRPTAAITDGGKVSYWKMAETVTDPDSDLELDGLHRKTLRDLMVIYAKERTGRAEESSRELAIWAETMERIANRVEHRSDDRRPALHLRSRNQHNRRMI
jgi:hypothetical protein